MGAGGVVMEDDLALARTFASYAVGVGNGMQCVLTITDPKPLRRAARALVAASDAIKAQRAVIEAQGRALRMQRLWAFAFGVAAIAALLVGPVRAEVPAVQHWGGSSAMLVPGDGAAVARVVCINRLTSGHDIALAFDLRLGGFEVAVRVEHGAGDIPDRLTVVPPAGFIAVPAFVDVGEHDQGVILIFSIEGVGA